MTRISKPALILAGVLTVGAVAPTAMAVSAGPAAPKAGETVLQNNTPITIDSAARGQMTYYRYDAPAGASWIGVGIEGGTGDADLYVRRGALPTTSDYDCRPFRPGNNEFCSGTEGGTYYIGVRSFSHYNDVELMVRSIGGSPVTSTSTSTTTSTSTSTTEPSTSTTEPSTSTTKPSTSTSTTTSPSTTAPPSLPAGPWGSDLSLARSNSAEDSKYPQMSNPEIDTLRYHLDLDWSGSTLKGKTTLAFRATQNTSRIRLDLGNPLSVSGVWLDGRPVTSSRDTNGLIINTGSLQRDSEHTFVIDYAGKPQSVPMPSGRTDVGELGWKQSSDGSVLTMQEPYGAFTWYPSNDTVSDKAYYSATITAPAGEQGVFNGELQSTKNVGGRTVNTFVLDKPAEAYLITIGIGKYMHERRTMSDGTPFNLWYLPQDQSSLTKYWSNINTAWAYLMRNMSKYPFASAGALVMGGGSAMETQTLISMNRKYMTTNVITHELAHQWNGDSVSPQDWKEMWLNEGWAMYWENEFTKAASVSDFEQICRRVSATAGPAGDYKPNAFGESNVYMCGGRVVYDIRQKVGDAKFAQFAKGWQEHKKYGNATREDFIAYTKQSTGYDPTAAMNNWLGAPPRG